MSSSIVVAFRMPPAGFAPGPEGSYLSRARVLCERGESLGGRLVAWSAALLAMAWEGDAIEAAVRLATSIRGETDTPARAWSGAIAEGDLEALGPNGQHMDLAWGGALLTAASLARVARPGEIVVDAGLGALRAGLLSVVGEPTVVDRGEPLSAWRLDLERPWKEPGDAPTEIPPPKHTGALVERVLRLAGGGESVAAGDAITRLRKARALAEGSPPSARCQAALALAVTLSLAGRADEALVETLDALARAKEGNDPKAVDACMALLSKLYASVGLVEAASALRGGIGV